MPRLYTLHTLQHAVTHRNMLQHTPRRCNTPGADMSFCNCTHCNILQHTATHCHTLPHSTTQCKTPGAGTSCLDYAHCNTLQPAATRCNTLQHAATRCNTLQHTATHLVQIRHAATVHCLPKSGTENKNSQKSARCKIDHTKTITVSTFEKIKNLHMSDVYAPRTRMRCAQI